MSGETWERQIIIFLRDEVDSLVVYDLFLFNDSFHVHGGQVAVCQSPFDRLPRGGFKTKTFQYFVYLLVGYFYWLSFQTNRLKLSQVHNRLQGNHCFVRHWLHAEHFQLGLHPGLDVFIL